MNTAAPTEVLKDEATLQLDANGNLRHLLTLKGLDKSLLTEILDDAQQYLTEPGELPARGQSLVGRSVANLFFEASTRTRASFDLAGKRLGADVLNLDVNTSSRKKGESILDTIYTLEAMHVDIMVVRDASAGVPAFIARHVLPHVSILNAGESDVSHPTQGLLDVLTMRQHKGSFEDLAVAIVGDIRHSRVAMSASHALSTLGVGELRLISPPVLAPEPDSIPGARVLDNLEEGLADADVVMALRIQRERIGNLDGIPGIDEYFANYGVSHESMKFAKPDAIVMHPGPMNRGIEIEGSLADGPQSVITRQVTNGVAIRMAVLDRVGNTMAAR
ncbi:MAG: aspartate carbamoyltransferase catalytic subunit [Gammaproteobacteria bacterium]|jgi:aspartate carbamoyltransferase catalytic subunit|nr:aspartate carbamoyltransferase catalytic subunit [Gammaproteobacteria bacterium]MDH3819606.1 aspartate carbamoyltransferase catalytic subunit [Gammaproteobacteria bacterium]MDH3982682.1 aspartate carbamoyltransferase catalytic subunit [Gammaproteobacteria bacterium]